MADAPKRACRFVLDLEADTRDDLATALYNIASQLERGELTKGVSGGYSSGYVYELIENERPTHDEWAQNLRAYLDQRKAAGGVRGLPMLEPTEAQIAALRVAFENDMECRMQWRPFKRDAEGDYINTSVRCAWFGCRLGFVAGINAGVSLAGDQTDSGQPLMPSGEQE